MTDHAIEGMRALNEALDFFNPGSHARACGDGARADTYEAARRHLAAMQRVVDAAVEVSAATTELAELHAIKRLDEAVRAMKEKRDHE